MAYSGKFKPKSSKKYIGDSTKIKYRSLWERRFMVYCDNSPAVIGWNSEEVVVPYISPVDNRWHRYFVDFLVVYKLPDGSRKTVLIEVKPLIQTKEPERKAGSKKTPKRFLKEVMTWGVNQAKWKAATEYAEERKWEFRLMTEKELT